MKKKINTVFYKKLIVVFLIGALAGGMIGYGYGFTKGAEQSIRWGVKVAGELIKRDKLTIEFSEQMVTDAIMQYQDRIDSCLFVDGGFSK